MRTVLAAILKRMNDDGFFPVVAIELEFYLVDRERRDESD